MNSPCRCPKIVNTDILIWGIFSLGERKSRRSWKPGLVEMRASNVARQRADREAARIPWRTLLKARRDFTRWQAYLLWVRAVEEAEGRLPSRLLEKVERHTRGYLRHVAGYGLGQQSGPSSNKTWPLLETWIDENVFGKPWQGGWMNAVGYYAVRDLAALRDEAYWSYCERQWKRSRPAVYPSFPEWQKASERCCDEALDEFEVRDETRELMKLSREVSPRTLWKTVDRYVDWQVFAYWVRTAIEPGKPLPSPAEREVKRRCPAFLQIGAVSRDLHSRELYQQLNRLIRRIEEREFATSKKQGWFPAVVYQAHLHPRYSRAMDYWRHWRSLHTKHPRAQHPTFDKWQTAVDAYTFEPEAD